MQIDHYMLVSVHYLLFEQNLLISVLDNLRSNEMEERITSYLETGSCEAFGSANTLIKLSALTL